MKADEARPLVGHDVTTSHLGRVRLVGVRIDPHTATQYGVVVSNGRRLQVPLSAVRRGWSAGRNGVHRFVGRDDTLHSRIRAQNDTNEKETNE